MADITTTRVKKIDTQRILFLFEKLSFLQFRAVIFFFLALYFCTLSVDVFIISPEMFHYRFILFRHRFTIVTATFPARFTCVSKCFMPLPFDLDQAHFCSPFSYLIISWPFVSLFFLCGFYLHYF
jgi:hypothetical protein